MKNEELIISENEYKRLFVKFLDDQTMTFDEMNKLKAYEINLKQQSEQTSQSTKKEGKLLSFSNTAGRALADEEYRQAGVASAVLIVIGVILSGIVLAALLIKL